MKKISAFILALIIIFMSLNSCSSIDKNDEGNEIVVFAAASLTETLSEIGNLYTQSNPDVKLTFNFDSSGTLRTQIEEGARCDLFISASPTHMNELITVSDNTRIDLLENKITLAVPKGNPANIYSFDNIANRLESGDLFMAIGNADVPVGEYTLKIFDFYSIDVLELEKIGCLTYGSNAKEVTTQVSEGMVDCGIVYQTDAFSANLEVVDTASVDMCGRVIYPAAVLETSNNLDAANDFLKFLSSDEASNVFEKVGFTHLT